jgi:hypothetical protein
VILEKFKRMPALRALALIAALLMCQSSFAYEAPKTPPTGIEMAADLIIGRPIGLVIALAGTAVFLVGLPFNAAGGNVKDSAEKLVAGPVMSTFVRCLGCPDSGYRTQHQNQ